MKHRCEIPACVRMYECGIYKCRLERRFGFCYAHKNRKQAIEIMENRNANLN